MFPRRKLAALLFSCIVVATRGQEDDDDDSDFQSPDEFTQAEVANEAIERATAGVMHNDFLYVGIETGSFLDEDNAGEIDIVIRFFDPDELTKEVGVQYGGDGDDTLTDLAADSSVMLDVVIVGGTTSVDEHLFGLDVATGEMDWYIATLDRDDLSVQESYVNGTTNDDQKATAVAIASDSGFVVAGWTWGTYFEANAGASNDDDSIGYDAWVIKLDEDLVEEWGIQFGTEAYDEPSKVVLDSDDNIYVVGTTTDASGILSDTEKEDIQSMFVYKLDVSDGDTLWSVTTELGSLLDESELHGAVLNEDESELYVSGNTKGIIGDFDGDATDSYELFLVSLDVDSGDINWVWQSEANATAYGSGGVVLAEDGSPIVGGIAFGNQFNLTSDYWVGGSGDMIAAKIDIDTLEVVKYFNAPAASNLTKEWPLAMVKVDDVDDGVYLIGYEDGDFEDEDVEPDDDDLNYLVLKVELDDLPEEDDDGDSEWDFPYWYVGAAVFALGIALFAFAYKCAESSQ
ncbi:unnamed protein product, partial [Ascophyllum nodosum]